MSLKESDCYYNFCFDKCTMIIMNMTCMSSAPNLVSNSAAWLYTSVSCSTVVRVWVVDAMMIRFHYHDLLGLGRYMPEPHAHHWFTMVVANSVVYTECLQLVGLRQSCVHCRLTTVAGKLGSLCRVNQRISVHDIKRDICRFTTATLPSYKRYGMGSNPAVNLLTRE